MKRRCCLKWASWDIMAVRNIGMRELSEAKAQPLPQASLVSISQERNADQPTQCCASDGISLSHQVTKFK